MDSLSYSLNATVPVFLLIVLGYALRRAGLMDESFVKGNNDLNFRLTLPVLLFCDMAGADLRSDFHPELVAFCAGVTMASVLGVWLLARRLLRDRAMVGAFTQAGYRSSVAVLGGAFIANLYADAGLAPQMILGCVPLYNIMAVLLLTLEGEAREELGRNMGRAVKGMCTNPILIGLLLGMLVSLLGVKFPPIVDKSLTMLGNMATPQALLCIGGGLELRRVLAKAGPALLAAGIKLVALPGIFLPLAVACGFREQALLTILIMLGSPTTPSCYVMAKKMGGDEVLTSGAIVAATLLSSVTLTFWIFLYRQLGLL